MQCYCVEVCRQKDRYRWTREFTVRLQECQIMVDVSKGYLKDRKGETGNRF
jgi:hypothetical protein